MSFDTSGEPQRASERPLKVLGFDAWTVGHEHYQRLIADFREKGLDLTLIHMGSWGDEKGRPIEETLNGLPVRDIAYYAGTTLSAILDAERPAAVIFTSVDSFANRAINRYCRERSIPTVHLFHGLQRVIPQDGMPQFRSRLHTRLWLLRKQIVKGLLHFWPVYIRSLVETRAGTDEWRRFFRDLADRAVGRRPAVTSGDSRADRACVFIGSEVEHVAGVYGYRPEHVIPVGNPDLIHFNLDADDVAMFIRGPVRGSTVMYIDGALVHYGWIYRSEADFVDHLARTRDRLAAAGLGFLVKPHPTHVPATLEAIRARGVEICPRKAFLPRLRECAAAIIEPSSAALLPMLLGLPVFLASYGPMAGQVYGEGLASYPRALVLDDVDAAAARLDAERAGLDPVRAEDWIRDNLGPMPAEGMPSRVADVILAVRAEHECPPP